MTKVSVDNESPKGKNMMNCGWFYISNVEIDMVEPIQFDDCRLKMDVRGNEWNSGRHAQYNKVRVIFESQKIKEIWS